MGKQQEFAASVGASLRRWRASRRMSQLALALDAGVSQRHLSYVETGRSQPSRELLHALMDALDVPLAMRNELLMQGGYAPLYAQRALASADLQPVRNALAQLLVAHEPSPALVLDSGWNLVDSNRGAQRLIALLLGDAAAARLASPPPNMLRLFFDPQGLRPSVINFDECAAALLHHVRQAMLDQPELGGLLQQLGPWLPRAQSNAHGAPKPDAPLLHTRLHSAQGELRFFSMFTTFGTPHDITVASLRVEHLFPADDHTRAVVSRW
jgi:transcriptional regulator with XRE-family HTH domain